MFRFLLAFLFPPLAILLCGRFFLFLVSIPLCIFYFPAALLALLVVGQYYSDPNRAYEHLFASIAAEMREGNRLVRKQMRMEKKARKEAEAALAGPSEPRLSFFMLVMKLASRILLLIGALSLCLIRSIPPAVSWSRRAGIRAYYDLPEWAQPITWGLAAGTPVSALFVLFMFTRK